MKDQEGEKPMGRWSQDGGKRTRQACGRGRVMICISEEGRTLLDSCGEFLPGSLGPAHVVEERWAMLTKGHLNCIRDSFC